VVTRLLATAVCLILASSSLFAEMYECTQLECTYQRIKDDGTLGPLRKKKNGETIIINDGDYDLSDGWVIVNPPA
jgi:hypothetical protein